MMEGESNPAAKLTDGEIELIRALYEEDQTKPYADRFWSAARLAERFEISKRHVRYILSYSRRTTGAGRK